MFLFNTLPKPQPKFQIASNRLGLGLALEHSKTQKGSNPVSWLENQINPANLHTRSQISSATESLNSSAAQQRQLQEIRKRPKNQQQPALKKAIKASQKHTNNILRNQRIALHQFYLTHPHPFQARLVRFWANHFTTGINNKISKLVCGAHINDAIIPNILGNFSDLLIASTLHPAMLNYLDNSKSVGENSVIGRRRDKDINENLAREILELHTLGVNSGYTQADIIQLANVLTGWRVRTQPPTGATFEPVRHEPGAFTILGRKFSTTKKQKGKNQVTDVLNFLAQNESTAQHICGKLCRHFLGQSTTKKHLQQLVKTYQKSHGDLPSLYNTLFSFEALWQHEPIFYKQPDEWLYSLANLIPNFTDYQWLESKARFLGKPTFGASSPAGWPDDDNEWLTSESLYRRKHTALEAAKRFKGHYDIGTIISTMLDPIVTDEHLTLALNAADNDNQRFALILLSPQMMYR